MSCNFTHRELDPATRTYTESTRKGIIVPQSANSSNFPLANLAKYAHTLFTATIEEGDQIEDAATPSDGASIYIGCIYGNASLNNIDIVESNNNGNKTCTGITITPSPYTSRGKIFCFNPCCVGFPFWTSTLTKEYVPIGYKINWGAYTGDAPTVTVWGV